MATNEPPLVDLKVTNPITYIKRWWNKIIGNEGIEFRFKIHPLTAIAITIIVASIAFGLGRFVLSEKYPFFRYQEINTLDSAKQILNNVPIVTSEPWRETGFTGTLQFSDASNKFYLLTTTSSEAITLEVQPNLNLSDYIGKRIFASGKYNKSTRILIVASALDLEILPKKPSSFPTTSPTPFLEISLTPTISTGNIVE